MKLKVAVIGLGNIAKEAHLPSYKGNVNVEISAVADIQKIRAKKTAEQYHCRYFQDYRELIDRVKPDAISVCTPPFSRKEIITYAAENGVAILCEKPMASNLKDANDMANVVDKTGVPFMMGFTLRFMSWYLRTKKRLEEGMLGDPVFLNGLYAARFPNLPWLNNRDISGGGVIIERGSHFIDLATWLLGVPNGVQAVTFNKRKMDIDETAFVVMHHQSAKSNLSMTFAVNKPLDRTEILGTAANIIVDHQLLTDMYLPSSDYILFNHLPNIVRNAARFYLSKKGIGTWENPYAREIGYFVELLMKGEDHKPNQADGLLNSRIIDACYRSSVSGNRIISL